MNRKDKIDSVVRMLKKRGLSVNSEQIEQVVEQINEWETMSLYSLCNTLSSLITVENLASR